MSGNNKNNEWGHAFWEVIRIIVENYPSVPSDSHKQHTLQFFNSLVSLLPCEECRVHYKLFLVNNIIPVDSRAKLANWVDLLKRFIDVKKNDKNSREINKHSYRDYHEYNYRSRDKHSPRNKHSSRENRNRRGYRDTEHRSGDCRACRRKW